MSGSWTNVSSMASTESLFERSTPITTSHVERKLPSMPLTSMALMSMRVRRKGTRSGTFSRFMADSKQSPKSMCMHLPVRRSKVMWLGCLSPRPSK